MGVDRATANAVQTLEFAGSPEVVALNPQIQTTQWEDQGDESRCGKGDDDQCKNGCDALSVNVPNVEHVEEGPVAVVGEGFG